jgi:hypothetical protein
MPNFNFPSNPSIGDSVFIGLYKYTWNGDSWDRIVVSVEDLLDGFEAATQNIDAGSSTTVFSVADINIDGGTA